MDLACIFGMPGSNNDLNVIGKSHLLNYYLSHSMPKVNYEVNGKTRTMPYWLVDGIYHEWECFVKAISDPTTPMQTLFTKCHESAIKDVERAFGVLQSRFHILVKPSPLWYTSDMKYIIYACIILHNMMVEYKRESSESFSISHEFERELMNMLDTLKQNNFQRPVNAESQRINLVDDLCAKLKTVYSESKHIELQEDLVIHM